MKWVYFTNNKIFNLWITTMTIIINGIQIAEKIKQDCQIFFSWYQNKKNKKAWLAIILTTNDAASATYVTKKQQRWALIDVEVTIYHAQTRSYQQLIDQINQLNTDESIQWIIVQLPLRADLTPYKHMILQTIVPHKDCDWLSGANRHYITPATPKAVLKALETIEHKLQGKQAVVIWQSMLIGIPLVQQLLKYEMTVFSCNQRTATDHIKTMCQQADIIISATGKAHLVNADHIRHDNTQIVIDVWFGIKDNKVCWDVDTDSVIGHLKAISKVPWWIGPITVACLFDNIRELLLWQQ